MKFVFNYKRKKINVNLKDCNILQRFIGLMFKRREKARILLFDFKKQSKLRIHSFFVFFPFIAVWLDEKNKVIEKKIVKPWKIAVLPKKPYYKLVEIPINEKYKDVVGVFGV